MVLLEKLKAPESRRADFEGLPPAALVAPDPKEEDEKQDCFELCLKELPVESLQLILQYYSDEKREKINAGWRWPSAWAFRSTRCAAAPREFATGLKSALTAV